MNGKAILQVTNALRGRLTSALAASGVPGTVFVGPLDDPAAGAAALTLFLYRVEPNASLRNGEHRVASADPSAPVVAFQNSLPLNLSYLVSAGNPQGSSDGMSLLALGHVMLALQVDPDLTGEMLEHEVVRVSLDPLSTEEISRVWCLFPTVNYRTSVAYLATPVWIDAPPLSSPAVAPVMEDSLFAAGRVAEALT